MCGLVGVAGDIDAKIIKVFNDMMIFNITRGRDSSGVASVHRGTNAVSLFKHTVHASELQEFKGYDRVVAAGKKVLIGHARSATVGSVSIANAHPFEFSHLVGAHNGTIPYHAKSDLPNHADFGTDSEALYKSVNDRGIRETISELTDGAYALTWYDQANNTINLLRNDQRPLCFGVINEGRTLIWASEAYFIRAACERHNIEHDKSIFILPVDRHYRWEVPDDSRLTIPLKPHVSEIKRKERQYTYTGNYFRQGPAVVGGGASKLPVPVTPPKTVVPIRPTIHTISQIKNTKRGPVIIGWKGQHVNRQHFKNKTGETCAFSDQIITFDDVVRGEEIVFISPTQFVSKEYYTPELVQFYGS